MDSDESIASRAAFNEQAEDDHLVPLINEMLAETGGPLTAAEREEADRLLGR